MPSLTKPPHVDPVDRFVSRFADFEERVSRNGSAWVSPIRGKALSRFREIRFPTRHVEAWKHTDVRPVVETEFEPAPQTGRTVELEAFRDESAFGEWDADRLVFIDGIFSESLSQIGESPAGVRVMSLAEALKTEREFVEPHLGNYADYTAQPFVALNTAFLEDGAFVYIPDGVVHPRPIRIVFVATESDTPRVAYPRNLILTGKESRTEIVESYEDLGNGTCLTNAVTELSVGKNARVVYYRMQQENNRAFHLASVNVRQEAGSDFSSQVISTGSAINRNDITCVLDGEGISSTVNGLFLTSGRRHIDNHTILDHRAPGCRSHETFKGILDGESSGAFTGKIIVRPDAQKTDAVQSSKNLLLSDSATVYPDPQLEIYADDVKCTHGATVGQLDPEAVFYIKSRGIDEASARGLLTYAFANEIIEKIDIKPLREHLERFISARFWNGAVLER